MDLAGPHGHRNFAETFADRHTSHIGDYPIRNKKDEYEHMHTRYCSDIALFCGT